MTKTAIATDDSDEEQDYGVCCWCGGINIRRIYVKDSFQKDETKPNRKECLDCGEIWGGLYRSNLKYKSQKGKRKE